MRQENSPENARGMAEEYSFSTFDGPDDVPDVDYDSHNHR